MAIWLVTCLLIAAATDCGRVREPARTPDPTKVNPFELHPHTDDGGYLVPDGIARVLMAMQARFDEEKQQRQFLEDQYL
jgi:hypothetical protein